LPSNEAPAGAAEDGAARDNWSRTLGLRFAHVSGERVVAYLDAGPQHHQPYGVLHGGVYCSIVEAVASYGAGNAALAAGQRGVLGVANSTDFYRSHSAGELTCVGTPVHKGRSAHVWQVEVTRSADGKLVARGQVRFHVLQELPAERTQEYADLEGRD
jgi:uncharacterized protein (TIGR00369 family)